MSLSRILGVVILVVGIALLITGYNASESAVDQISETVAGRYTDETIWYLIAGIAGVVGGGLLMMLGRRG